MDNGLTSAADPADIPPREVVRKVLDVISGRALLRWTMAFLTVPRLVLLLTLVLCGATGWWTWSTYRYRAAVATLEEELPLAQVAFDAGEIDAAIPHVRAAARAGRVIGPKSVRAKSAVQLERELEGWRRLATMHIGQFFAEHEATPPSEFAEAFEFAFANRTLIVDGLLIATDASPGAADPHVAQSSVEYTLDWTWIDEEGRQVEFVFEQCPAFAHIKRGSSERVILAAEVERIVLASPGSSHWRAFFKPDSVTFLTALGPLQRAGWPGNTDIEDVLLEQRQRLGINE